MEILTGTQEYTTHEVGKIVIDDTVDIVVVKKDNSYTVKVIKNYCYPITVEEVDLESVGE